MKFTLSWLKDHLDTTATLDQIVTKLTAIGLEVESLHDPAAQFAAFKVAHVLSAEKHPDADRLRVCIVDTGTEKLQVVCGAPNARAGMKAVFAPAGSLIPATNTVLKKGNIRGQESNGMLVSEAEMGLSTEAKGIIEAPTDAIIGTPLATLYGLDDPVIEINLTPNRADCAGVRGIARDLAAAGLGTLKPLDANTVKGSFISPLPVVLDLPANAKDACPLFIGRTIRGVKNGPSPEWLQRRLKAIGLRPISSLVDITNYICHDLCRPLHVFDADKVQGPVTARLARDGETLEALDGKTYTLTAEMTVIADRRGAQGIAGVMGGMATACDETTTNVYLECAYFDPLRTARTGRSLQINSDARYRFERGVDPAFTVPAAEIATRMILELCGGEASETVIAGAVPPWQREIKYNSDYCRKLAGFAIPALEQEKFLKALGFIIDGDTADALWSIIPPSWRADVEGRADLVEEVLRIRGYDAIPAIPLTKINTVTHSAETPNLTMTRKARQALAARGLDECVTWSFMPHDRAAKFSTQGAPDSLRLLNPISADLDQMRPSILPNLLDAAGRNAARGFADVALFEVGPVFTSARVEGGLTMAAGLRAGAHGTRHWDGGHHARSVDAFDVKADVFAVLEACGVNIAGLQLTRDVPAWYHPGQAGVLKQGQKTLATFGAIHPALLEDYALTGLIAGFEIFMSAMPAGRKRGTTTRKLLQLSPLQAVQRDFAFIVAKDVAAADLVRAALTADKDLITRADVFDVYTGKGVADGYKSVALNITIQPQQKTLTDVELEALAQKITANVTAKTGGSLRA